MTRQITLIVLCAVFLCAATAAAEEALTWHDCLREALEKHPDLVSSKEAVKKSEAGRDAARSGLYPQIDSGASARTSESDGARSDSHSYSVSGRQLIFDGSKTTSKIKSAEEGVKSTRYNRDVTSSNIRLRLRIGFVSLLRAQQLVRITEEIAARRKHSMELVRLRYEAGKEHKGSLLTAEANLAQAELEVKQADRDIEFSRTRLSKELGRRKAGTLMARGDLKVDNPPRKKPAFANIADAHPMLRELAARKDAAGHDLEAAKADFLPTVYANASAGRSDSDWPPDDDSWSAGVTISYPIFEGRSRAAAVRRNRASLRKVRADETSGRDSVVLTLTETWIDFQNAADAIRVRDKFLEAAEERAKIAQAQYSTGLISFDNWIIIEDDLVKARKACLEAQARALNAEARWIQAKGGVLEDG